MLIRKRIHSSHHDPLALLVSLLLLVLEVVSLVTGVKRLSSDLSLVVLLNTG